MTKEDILKDTLDGAKWNLLIISKLSVISCEFLLIKSLIFHEFQEFSRWGYCDDASALPSRGDPLLHRYFEVETTLLPNEVCKLQSNRYYFHYYSLIDCILNLFIQLLLIQGLCLPKFVQDMSLTGHPFMNICSTMWPNNSSWRDILVATTEILYHKWSEGGAKSTLIIM